MSADTVHGYITLVPIAESNSETCAAWGRLEWDDEQVPAMSDGTRYKTLVDEYPEGRQYLHVPERPHPDDPQTPEHWCRCRVYCKYVIGGKFRKLPVRRVEARHEKSGWHWAIYT